jgi:outer membrane receptor protein involved in Fe transport
MRGGKAKGRPIVIGTAVRLAWLLTCVGAVAAPHEVSRQNVATTDFHIAAGDLADALDRFGEQSGLQIVYDRALVAGKHAPDVTGDMTAGKALDLLLQFSAVEWAYANDMTIVIRARTPPSFAAREDAGRQHGEPEVDAGSSSSAASTDVRVIADPLRVLPRENTEISFGFSKSLLETPRSVSVVSQETIDLFGLSAVEDLVRFAPGVYTTTRFGIQGSVDVRNVPADTFFRGMKRLTLQGNGRSVLAAMDTIEVVGGPPSPIYGMGKIGGYTNMVPKSGRAATGEYLTETEGFAQLIRGTYGRSEASFGIGGPLTLLDGIDRPGGYYVYGLVEDSGSYTDGVPVRQEVLQAAVSVDNMAGPFRLETGMEYQNSRTAGALTGRLTQALVDTGKYIRGTPLVNLDLDGNGTIGYLEMQQASPVLGQLSANNQPLIQVWAWPRDAHGNPLPLNQFPKVTGIPSTMYAYLVAHPQADPTGLLRAQGPGGPLPMSGSVPIGMVLDPSTVGFGTLDLRRAAAYERDLQAKFLTAFADLIDDEDPNFTMKNQMFFDGMWQFKTSNQPYAVDQQVYVVEDKFTLTRRLTGLPPWVKINSLASVNIRDTVSRGRYNLGDYASSRTDAMASTWVASAGGMTPNTTFANPIDNSSLTAGGFPWITDYRTEYSEIGVGALFDIDLASATNLIVGGRVDGSEAQNVDYAGRFNPTTGTSADPGAFISTDSTVRGWDHGPSWNLSLSQRLPGNVHPYVTVAHSSIVLDANNNALTGTIIKAGHIGAAQLQEAGLKGLWLDGRMFFTGSVYRERRTDVSEADDPTVINAYPTSTITRGTEAELKWVPRRNLFVSLYGLHQVTKYDPNVGGLILVDARALGFQDVTDAAGHVVYPAEAFLYGGRAYLQLPDNMPQYATKQGNPPTQAGFAASYQLGTGPGITFSGNYFSSTCSGRLCLTVLPSATVLNSGVFWDTGTWSAKLDIFNLTNKRYFRARTGDTLGDVLAQAMPDRHLQLTIKANFH